MLTRFNRGFSLILVLCLCLPGVWSLGCSDDTSDPVTQTDAADAGLEVDLGLPQEDATPDAEPDVPSVGCVEDELSPNHEAGDATPITIGTEYDALAICSEVQDVFLLSLEAGEEALVMIEFSHQLGDLDLLVYETTDTALETPIAGSQEMSDVESVALGQEDTATSYYVVVIGWDYAENEYDLSVLTACSIDDDCTGDLVCDRFINGCVEYEEPECGADGANDPNGTDSQAVVIDLASDSANLTGFSTCVGDLDFFEFTVNDGDTITATLGGATPDVNVGLYLMLDDGSFVTSTWLLSRPTLTEAHFAAGTYYFLTVIGTADAETAYTLNVTREAGQCEETEDCVGATGRAFCQDNGVCDNIEGDALVALGENCDSDDDCVDAADACYRGSVSADGWICTTLCTDDGSECDAITGTTCVSDIYLVVDEEAEDQACLLDCGIGEDMNDELCAESHLCDAAGHCIDRTCTTDDACEREGHSCVIDSAYSPSGNCNDFEALACTDGQPNEPNDTDTNATQVVLVDGEATLEDQELCWVPERQGGYIVDADLDVDLYRLTIDTVGTLDVTITYDEGSDVDVMIQAVTGETFVGYGVSEDTAREHAEALLVKPGDYIVRVVPYFIPDEGLTYMIAFDHTAEVCTGDDGACFETRPLRRECNEAGACVDFDGAGAVALGGECDTADDCEVQPGLCTTFGDPAEGEVICSVYCVEDGDCDVVPDTVCARLDFFTWACVPESLVD